MKWGEGRVSPQKQAPPMSLARPGPSLSFTWSCVIVKATCIGWNCFCETVYFVKIVLFSYFEKSRKQVVVAQIVGSLSLIERPDCSSCFLALVWSIPSYFGHLGVKGWKLYLFCSVHLYFSQTDKYIKNEKKWSATWIDTWVIQGAEYTTYSLSGC